MTAKGAKEFHGSSLWGESWEKLKKNRIAMASAAFVLFSVALSLFGPLLLHWGWGYDYETQNLAYGPRPPTFSHWFGTDYYGRDLLTRTLFGAQISLAVGIMAALVSALIGTVYGAISAYLGGRVDGLMMRIVDVLYTLPYMFLVIVLVTIFGKNLFLLFLALGAVGWLMTARIVRGQVLSLKEKEFILAARSLGASHRQIIFRHLIPNTLGVVVIYFTLTIPSMILQEAFLSFLGLGVQAPRPSLGALINDGAHHMIVYWWELLFPGLAMASLLLALNFLGDGLRDALDPKLRD